MCTDALNLTPELLTITSHRCTESCSHTTLCQPDGSWHLLEQLVLTQPGCVLQLFAYSKHVVNKPDGLVLLAYLTSSHPACFQELLVQALQCCVTSLKVMYSSTTHIWSGWAKSVLLFLMAKQHFAMADACQFDHSLSEKRGWTCPIFVQSIHKAHNVECPRVVYADCSMTGTFLKHSSKSGTIVLQTFGWIGLSWKSHSSHYLLKLTA